jgi:hypothetical protein
MTTELSVWAGWDYLGFCKAYSKLMGGFMESFLTSKSDDWPSKHNDKINIDPLDF